MIAKRDDRGATAVFLAMVLLLLIGVSAVALDLARGWNERRQSQTAVDVSGVAGALSFDQSDTFIVDQVMDTARQNLDTVYSDADWDSQWASCAGPPPAGFTPLVHSSLGTIDCIGINVSHLWVRLPEQTIDTTFAKAIGFQTISTGAEATVTLLPDSGSGALPFAILGDATPGEVCLDTGTGKPVPPCEKNHSGSFGNIAPPLFGNERLGTSPSCGNQTSANNYVPEGIAMGIDHRIWAFSQSEWDATGWSRGDDTKKKPVEDAANMDECIDTGDPIAAFGDGRPINAVYVDTGNNVKADVTEGLVTGTGFPDGDGARLTRTSNPRSVDGYSLDNVPLWDHLLEEGDHGIKVCDGSDIHDLKTVEEKNDAMRDCFVAYPDGVSPAPQIFDTDSILNTPRIGIAPRIWHDNLGSGLSYRPVEKFDVVYLHGLWFDDKDKTVFYPGESGTLNMKKWKDVEQVTAYLLDDNMVSSNVHDELGGQTNDTWQPEIWE